MLRSAKKGSIRNLQLESRLRNSHLCGKQNRESVLQARLPRFWLENKGVEDKDRNLNAITTFRWQGTQFQNERRENHFQCHLKYEKERE